MTSPGFCMDAVTDMCYYVFHGPDGSIQKTVVDITVSNVSMATAPSATYVRQEYQLEFVPTHGPRKASSDEAGNTIMRGRSGNPGYLTGLPLLSGELETYGTKEAINARIPGLSVFASPTSPYCDPHADIPETSLTVNFGEDMVSGCILELSYQNFSSFCSQVCHRTLKRRDLHRTEGRRYCYTFFAFLPLAQNNEHMRDTGVSGITSKVPKYIWINSSFTYIGIFGNADPLDISQWMQMDIDANSNTPSFDANDRLCTDMPTSLHYEFLYAYVGSTQSPQAKIVGARAYYGYEDIVFSSELGTQHIMITTTVSFTLLGQNGYEKYTPGVPPVLWTVPYDVFYPFDVSAAPSNAPVTSLPTSAFVSLLLSGLLFRQQQQ